MAIHSQPERNTTVTIRSRSQVRELLPSTALHHEANCKFTCQWVGNETRIDDRRLGRAVGTVRDDYCQARSQSKPDQVSPHRAAVPHRCAQGKTKTEAIRCLKRYVARELYTCLPHERLA